MNPLYAKGDKFFGTWCTEYHGLGIGKEYASWANVRSVKEKIDVLHEQMFPDIPKRPKLVNEIFNQTMGFLLKKCHLPYAKKEELAVDIAQLVDDLNNDLMPPGEAVGKVLDFASKHDITQIIIDNSEGIARLACDIWAENAEKTESIGFDKTAVLAMRPVIELVLKEGLTKKGETFEQTKQFVKTLVDMIAMDYAHPDAPVLVDLTESIFNLTSTNETIRKQLSSEDQSKLTPESEGLKEYFRGYFCNLFKQFGLKTEIKNTIELLETKQNEAITIVSQKKGQQAVISEIKAEIYKAKLKLKQAQTNLEDFELSLQAQAKLTLLDHVEKWNAQRKEILANNQENDPEAMRKLEDLMEKANAFAKRHHIEGQLRDISKKPRVPENWINSA